IFAAVFLRVKKPFHSAICTRIQIDRITVRCSYDRLSVKRDANA
ncbi:unnamed protein product, partial [Oikopleura dioica]